jgi:rhodanese-related sulfurtransferase/rubrerythrin
MGFMDYFRSVSSWSVDKVRDFLKERAADDYNLVDVRQPEEYSQGHLPGAKLIPVGALQEHLKELDPSKPTITYCAVGPRSRAAASVLSRAGFKEVHMMRGGLNAWKGIAAQGFPEASMVLFPPEQPVEETIALAWLLEEGTRRFYDEIAHMLHDHKIGEVFRELTSAEMRHKALLSAMYKELPEKQSQADDLSHLIPSAEGLDPFMEGGIRLREAIAWLSGKQAKEILEFSVALETNAYDRYLSLARGAANKLSQRVFETLSREEKQHLERLTEAFEQMI